MNNDKINKGFTLIELLIVISIIAILAAIAIFGIGNIFERARNTQRTSDVRQYQNALETFANSHEGLYPARTSNVGHALVDACCEDDLGLSDCPDDPLADEIEDRHYRIETTGDSGGGCSSDPCALADEYVLWAQTEPDTDGDYWVVCSNGESGEASVTPAGGDGVCPL